MAYKKPTSMKHMSGKNGGKGGAVHAPKIDSNQGTHDKGINRRTGSASKKA